ncbi:hypothetical protein [Halovulum sp. GXIMD14793]
MSLAVSKAIRIWTAVSHDQGQRPARGGREAPAHGAGRALPGVDAGRSGDGRSRYAFWLCAVLISFTMPSPLLAQAHIFECTPSAHCSWSMGKKMVCGPSEEGFVSISPFENTTFWDGQEVIWNAPEVIGPLVAFHGKTTDDGVAVSSLVHRKTLEWRAIFSFDFEGTLRQLTYLGKCIPVHD